MFVSTYVCIRVRVHAFSLPEASRGCRIGAHAANTLQVAVWDRPGRLVTVCSPSPASFICYGSGQNAISCEGEARGWSSEGAGGCKEHQRTLKAIRNLSTASTACQLASPRSPCGAPGRQLWLNTPFTVFVNMWVCVWVRRIKIPLHLEAQTPWARALRAAIRHVAVWGEGHSLSPLPPYLSNTNTRLLSSPSLPPPLALGPACWLSVLQLLSVEVSRQGRPGRFD